MDKIKKNSIMRSILIIQIVLITISSLAISQPQNDHQAKLDLIDIEIKKTIETKNIPSLSIAIVLEGNETYFLNYGNYYRNSDKTVTEESQYQIASLGKTFIGLIAHNLILEGKIWIDQPLTDFIDFEVCKRTYQKLQKVTIQKLLHHYAGVPTDGKAGFKRKDGEPYIYEYTESDLIKDIMRIKIRSANKSKYSNFGYALLAYIMEKATNLSYPELLDKYINEPYGLKSTMLNILSTENNRVVTPYRKDDRRTETKPWIMGKLGPPSAVYSTTTDLSKLIIAQIAAYRSYNETNKITPLILTSNTTSPKYGYGYGFIKWGNGSYGHTGDMDGYASDYSINPENNYGIALLTSSGEKWITPLIIKINKILTEDQLK